MNPFMISLLLVGILLAFTAWTMVNSYNRLVMLKKNVDKAFANIDVVLKQRADEIPELVKVVKDSKAYEQSTLTKLMELRTRYMETDDVDEKIEAANALEKSLKSLFAVAENYPDLQASKNLIMLQGRVTEIEDRIADRREFFNESVNNYNIGIEQFPEILLSRLLGYQPRPMLEISEEEKAYAGVDL